VSRRPVGYPAHWRTYDGLNISRTSLAGNVAAANAFEQKRRLAKAGRPTDTDEWGMTPPTVNAYSDWSRNLMVFPAGFLQPPFYGNFQTPAANYGAIGAVVGHELTHAFDDQGRKYDSRGNLRDWWTPAVAAEFDRRASCLSNQFDGYLAVDDLHVRGKLTLGENIADLGGLRLAYAAFERAEREHPATPPFDGFTPEQQFFLGFAQQWCANVRPEELRMHALTDEHSPRRWRVDGTLSNIEEFAAAFQCKEGQAMVRDKDRACTVW
jgi:putative endopeptidase